MLVLLKGIKATYDAKGEYNVEDKTLTVLKGSILSSGISYANKFRGAKTIEKYRQGNVENNTLLKDVKFKSASTAANFVTGGSTNGLVAWKTVDGKTLRDIVKLEKGIDV